ncbi:complement C1s-1 subcomponent-like [Styela clava]
MDTIKVFTFIGLIFTGVLSRSLKKCEDPIELLSIDNGHVVNYTLTEDFAKLTIQCDEWYEIVAGGEKWKCGDDGIWRTAVFNKPNPPKNLPICAPACGIKGGTDRSLLSMHISGGERSAENEWPWLVFLNGGEDPNLESNHLTCGGSLINQDYVLTAAHCVVHEDYPEGLMFANHIHIWLGVHDRQEKNYEQVNYVLAEKVIKHPKFRTEIFGNYDVALVKLSESVAMTARYRPICLPSTEEDFKMVHPGSTGEIAGWGLYSGFNAAYTLFHAEFPVVGGDECLAELKSVSEEKNLRLPEDFVITDNMFCAGLPKGGAGTCEGDSGGPFVMKKEKNGRYYAVGLVSFGLGNACGETFTYTGYTKLNEEILNWVRQTMAST